jgi:hypothetical protein
MQSDRIAYRFRKLAVPALLVGCGVFIGGLLRSEGTSRDLRIGGRKLVLDWTKDRGFMLVGEEGIILNFNADQNQYWVECSSAGEVVAGVSTWFNNPSKGHVILFADNDDGRQPVVYRIGNSTPEPNK